MKTIVTTLGCLLLAVTVASAQPRLFQRQQASYPLTEQARTVLSQIPAAQTYVPSNYAIQYYMGEGMWLDYTDVDFTYENGHVKEVVAQALDFTTFTMYPSARTVYTYDSDKVTGYTVYFWDTVNGVGSWMPEERYAFTYQSGRLQAAVQEYYGYYDQEWHFLSRSTASYSPTQVTVTEEMWNGEAWGFSTRTTLTQQGQNVVQLDETWNSSQWRPEERQTMINASIEAMMQEEEKFITGDVFLMLMASGALTVDQPDYVTERHDGEAWYNYERFTQTRTNGKVTLALTEEGDLDSGAWMNNNKVAFTYEGDHMTEMRSSFWEAETAEWFLSFVNRYEYDANGNVSVMHVEMDEDEDGEVEPAIRVILEWEAATGTANEAETPQPSSSLSNYPNPFAGQTEVAFTLAKPGQATLRVYDVMGREVATLAEGAFAAGVQRVPFVADGLPAGTYFLRLEVDGAAQARTVTLVK